VKLKSGTYKFGPSGGQLCVKTRRGGAAFLVGKHLTIEVTEWEGVLEVGEDPADTRVELTVDGGSLKVTDGEGGPVTLTDLDKKSISETVNEDVLEGAEIKFRSDAARPSEDGSCIYVTGDLEISDEKTSLEFRLTVESEDDEEDEKDEDEDDGDEESEGEEGGEARGREDDGGEDDGGENEGGKNEGAEDESGDDDDSDGEEGDEPGPEQRISGRAVFQQTEVGLKPHSTLLGLLRVRDEVEVTFESKLEQ
jgi:polyisoprenoid-binding protein YceI